MLYMSWLAEQKKWPIYLYEQLQKKIIVNAFFITNAIGNISYIWPMI